MKIGVLALQGNFSVHHQKILEFGETPIYVKDQKSLYQCDGLIIPGGESTVISKMLDYNKLRNLIIDLKDQINIMGVCAGMVLLSKTVKYQNLKTLSIMDFEVNRNGYGRQIYSFNSEITFLPSKSSFKACFIRAPKVYKYSKEIKCLATLNQNPIVLTDGQHLACSFHPEYSSNFDIYNYFKNLIESN